MQDYEKTWVKTCLHSVSATRARDWAQDIIKAAHGEDKWDALKEVEKILHRVVLEAYSEGSTEMAGKLQHAMYQAQMESVDWNRARNLDIEEALK